MTDWQTTRGVDVRMHVDPDTPARWMRVPTGLLADVDRLADALARGDTEDVEALTDAIAAHYPNVFDPAASAVATYPDGGWAVTIALRDGTRIRVEPAEASERRTDSAD